MQPPHPVSESLSRTPVPRRVRPMRVLVAADLDETGESAIRVGQARALETGGRLGICHVVPDKHDAAVEQEAFGQTIRAALGTASDRADVFVLSGDAAEQIHACAESWNADMVVIGRNDHPGNVITRLFKTNVVDKVMRWSPCAVLVTRHAPGTKRIIVGVDFADLAAPLLVAAAEEQARAGGTVTVVHCMSPYPPVPIGDPMGGVAVPQPPWEEIEDKAGRELGRAIAAAGLEANTTIVQERPADGVIGAAKELSADLIIVGTHDRSRLARLALGSVAREVVRDAPCPVLVIRLSE
jgi:nucleotide-binding universal stress UspA family protein